jgi:hypothetical protein
LELQNKKTSGFTHGFQGDNGGDSYLTLDGIKSSGWLTGIYISGPGHVVKNCEIFGNKQTGIHAPKLDWGRISQNNIHDNGTVGINSDGIYADHGLLGGILEIDQNTIVNHVSSAFGACYIDGATGIGNPGDMIIRDNICIGGARPANTGIAPGGGTDDSRIYVYGNYVDGCYTSYEARNLGQHIVWNNTFIQTRSSHNYFDALGLKYPFHIHEIYPEICNKVLNIRDNKFFGPVCKVYATDIYKKGGRSYIIQNNSYDCITDTTIWATLGNMNYTWENWLLAGYY